MKTKVFSTLAVAALAAPIALSIGSASAADAPKPTQDTTADFTVNTEVDPTDPSKPNGQVLLEKVPSFNFGTIDAADLISGVKAKAATADDQVLEVSDLRSEATDAWNVSAKMTQFKGATSNLDGQLDLAAKATGLATASDVKATLPTTNQTTSIASKAAGTHGVTDYTFAGAENTLTTTANAAATFTKDEAVSATITWTLNGASVDPASL